METEQEGNKGLNNDSKETNDKIIKESPTEKSSGSAAPSTPADMPRHGEEGEEEGLTADASDDDRAFDDMEWEDERKMEMPLFRYARMTTPWTNKKDSPSSPQQVALTCCKMSRIIWPQDDYANQDAGGGNSGASNAGGGSKNAAPNASSLHASRVLLKQQQLLVMAMGLQNGNVHLLHPFNSKKQCQSLLDAPLKVSGGTNTFLSGDTGSATGSGPPIVDVCLDSSGHIVAAMNEKGLLVIWELKYTHSPTGKSTGATSSSGAGQGGSAASSTNQPAEENVFTSFLTSFAAAAAGNSAPSNNAANRNSTTINISDNDANDDDNNDEEEDDEDDGFTIGCTVTQTSRIAYPITSSTRPTCIQLDPSYKRRREKAVLVGFSDGRLVLTKRGYFFQGRNDAVLYQGTGKKSSSSDDRGIETIAWRGPLVACADTSGIRLFDVETMTRIAHIDRPAGARASLYPTISSLRPSLVFETSNKLLVAWGDAVMGIDIKEVIVSAPSAVNHSDPLQGLGPGGAAVAGAAIIKKRHVECPMAWELDCIACDVVPFDEDHLVVLGLVPEDEPAELGSGKDLPPNDLEVQVISRSSGAIHCADIIPITRLGQFSGPKTQGHAEELASAIRMLSTFALPRMEDGVEVEEEGDHSTALPDFDFNLFANVSKAAFTDPHRKWKLDSLTFRSIEIDHDKENNDAHEQRDSALITDDDQEDKVDDDARSTDSDEYDFLLHSSKNGSSPAASGGATSILYHPPLMVIASPGDTIAVRIRNVDDAISHALEQGRHALALKRGIEYRRLLRQHDLKELVNVYLRAVLRVPADRSDGDVRNGPARERKLSIRRLELAAMSTPVLLGGDVEMWETWIEEFRRIPGALFVLSEYLPVRDPKLPSTVYESVLKTLFRESEVMEYNATRSKKLAKTDSSATSKQAANRFLASLCRWGSTHALREKIKFQEYHRDHIRKKSKSVLIENPYLEANKILLQRRLTQTAAVYLQTSSVGDRNLYSNGLSGGQKSGIVNSTKDALFEYEKIRSMVAARVSFIGEWPPAEILEEQHGLPDFLNSKIAIEALAELNVISTSYEMALCCYLALGSLYSSEPLEDLEKAAIQSVNSMVEGEAKILPKECHPYGFVLSMIEHHHLHGCLLDPDFLPPPDPDLKMSPPLISLIRLVGLDLIGEFLIDHSVPPPRGSQHSSSGSLESKASEKTETSRVREGNESLPINLVADQLMSSPRLLHWYLHMIFLRKPEMYVVFPNTAVPSRAITDLHRIHLDLYVDYAQDKDSARTLLGTEVYNLERKTTPLLSFLKAALPIGGIGAMEVRGLLERQRSTAPGDSTFPHAFAIELAYVIEHFGENSEEEARKVLDLYLRGACSVMLAVSYAQRNKDHSTMLWDTLIKYCLELESSGQDDEEKSEPKSSFGALLEAAALCGADLALLVTRIPEGMNVDGLRPRLVAAVGDYRLKLQMHKSAGEVGNKEKIDLLRHLGHRSRRGMRCNAFRETIPRTVPPQADINPTKPTPNPGRLHRRPRERPNRYSLNTRLPIR